MRLTIDAIPLLFRSAGVKNYLYHWIDHLRRQPAAPEIRLFPWLGDLPPLDHQAPLAGPRGNLPAIGCVLRLESPATRHGRAAGSRRRHFSQRQAAASAAPHPAHRYLARFHLLAVSRDASAR